MILFERALNDHLESFRNLTEIKDIIIDAGQKIATALEKGKRVLVCGNGGSAADAQHFSAEIIGRFKKDRKAWPAIALTTNSSILTAVANDYAYDEIFSRQVEGLGAPGDILISISTSGNSKNIIMAANKASELNMMTIGLLGKDGGKLKTMVDNPIVAPSKITAHIQEMHIFILHVWADIIETFLSSGA